MFDNQRMGQYIQFLRKNKGLTQSKLADALGVSHQAVSNWERGESMPDIALLSTVARVLGTTADRILSAAESDAPNKDPLSEPVAPREEPEVSPLGQTEQSRPAAGQPAPPPGPDSFVRAPRAVLPREAPEPAISGLRKTIAELRESLKDTLSGWRDVPLAGGIARTVLDEVGDALKDAEEEIEDAEEELEDAKSIRSEADRRVSAEFSPGLRPSGDQWKEIVGIAPFASPETLYKLVCALPLPEQYERLTDIAPFLDGEHVTKLFLDALQSGADSRVLTGLAPFTEDLDSAILDADVRLAARTLSALAPFLEQGTVDELIRRRLS